MLSHTKAHLYVLKPNCDRTWSGSKDCKFPHHTRSYTLTSPRTTTDHRNVGNPERRDGLPGSIAKNWNWNLKDSRLVWKTSSQPMGRLQQETEIFFNIYRRQTERSIVQHRPENEILDLRASANATESSATMGSETNQNLRYDSWSTRRARWVVKMSG